LPTGNAPSSHILKIGGTTFSHLVANEALVTAFARELGLDVVNATLLPTRRAPLLLVRRFDRVVADGGGGVRRLHQEDMCQTLGRLPSRKYEIEGGPSLGECVEVLRAHSATPLVDTERILRWAAFNLLAGNADGHGKNLSLLCARAGTPPSLSPFYDLVCTRAYRVLDRRLAMRIGGEADPGQIGARHWRLLARELAVSPKSVLDIVGAMVESARPALARAAQSFREAHGEHPALQLVTSAVRRQIRRTEQLLASA
jgi:serine/threonine-protein kinase HipA